MSDWQWLNARLIAIGLEDEPDEVVEAVLHALDAIAKRPFEPLGVRVHQMRGHRSPDVLVAWLPFGFFLTYRPYEVGPVPYAGPSLVVRDFGRIDALDE